MTLRLGILCSGGGTNLQALLDACASRALDASVALVIVNRASAGALARAERAGVEARYMPHAAHESREAYDQALVAALRDAGVELVVLAGFMRIVTPTLLDAFADRVINIHPALLPSFPGVDAQAQALACGVTITGCTVHFVDAGTDTGPIIAQAAVPVADDDTRDSLAARVLVREHALLVDVVSWFAQGLVHVERSGDARPRVRVKGYARTFGVTSSPDVA